MALLLCGCLLAACRTVPPPPGTPIAQAETPCRAALQVASTPADAQVLLDGQPAGNTPLLLSPVPGPHQITLQREGYAAHRMEIEARCGATQTLAASLHDIAPPGIALDELPARVAPEEGLKVVAQATDNEAIAAMSLYIDETLAHSTGEASLRHNIDTRALAPGPHQGRILARDAAGNEAAAIFAFEIVAPTATPSPIAPSPTATVAPSPSATATVAPSATPTPTRAPTATPPPTVAASQGEISLLVYDYEGALYTDPEGAGHPYPLLDHDRVGPPVSRTYRTIVLRNEYLELVILPELGGRIYQMRYLPTGQPLLYNNRIAKPTRWGPLDQGWWLALGGIEFALPVDEHGYLTAQPWEASISRESDGSATVSLHILEQTRRLDVRVEITLRPREAGIHLRTWLRNQSDQAQSFQYWVNAMLSPGQHGVGPGLRLTLPAETVVVHSSGDIALPPAGGTMPWPLAAGRDLSRYGEWRNWLGVFAPRLSAPFVAAYDEDAQIGLVHAFSPAMQGVKLFGFGRDFDASAFADDGAHYVELWGGLSPSFWQDASLAAGESVSWQDAWYVVAQSGGVDFATADASLYARRDGDRLHLTVASPGEHRWRLRVSQGERLLLDQTFTVRPDAPLRASVDVGNTGQQVDVHILASDGSTVARHGFW